MFGLISKSGQKVDPTTVVNVREVSNAHTSEYVYYECQGINLTDSVIECAYNENRVQPIVDKPSDYKFSVQRIEVSLVDVEMFNSDDRVLTVTNRYDPDNLTSTVVVNIGSNVDVYNIDQVIPEINDALQTAFDNIVTAYDAIYGPGSWAVNPNLAQEPFGVVYENDLDRLTIYGDVLNDNTSVDAVALVFNEEMEELFRGNAYSLTEERRVLFFRDFGDLNVVTLLGTDYIANKASYSTTALWYSVKQIVVTSDKVGARLVNIGTPGETGKAVSKNIILDFNYIVDNGPNAPGSRLQYLSNNNRWTDLVSDTPLHSMDFKLFYRNKDERLIPIKLRPGESFSILCLFAKTLTT